LGFLLFYLTVPIRNPIEPAAVTTALERHYTPKEISVIWALDESTVRKIFVDEEGVLRIGKDNKRDGKRDYITLRIPQSVLERVYRARTKSWKVQK
jgi:hypothetical protein